MILSPKALFFLVDIETIYIWEIQPICSFFFWLVGISAYSFLKPLDLNPLTPGGYQQLEGGGLR